jgi:hypothetical protein
MDLRSNGRDEREEEELTPLGFQVIAGEVCGQMVDVGDVLGVPGASGQADGVRLTSVSSRVVSSSSFASCNNAERRLEARWGAGLLREQTGNSFPSELRSREGVRACAREREGSGNQKGAAGTHGVVGIDSQRRRLLRVPSSDSAAAWQLAREKMRGEMEETVGAS